MSRYSKEHYEDVARVIADATRCYEFADSNGATPADIVNGLADLFAADNPPTCAGCNPQPGDVIPASHAVVGGFDRGQFLATCGLEPESKGTHLPSDILGREY